MTEFLINPYRFAATAAFNPITGVGWAHAYWTEGTEFTALSYSNGGAVSSWPDEVGTDDLAQATGIKQPLYRASTGPGSKPAVQGDASNDLLQVTFGSSIASSWTVVVVAREKVSANQRMFDNGAGGGVAVLDVQSTPNYSITAGTARTGGTPSNDTDHLYVVCAGTSPYFERDGTSIVTSTIGTNTLTGLTLFSDRLDSTRKAAHLISFVGVYNGDARGDAGWASFKSWVSTNYGITVA